MNSLNTVPSKSVTISLGFGIRFDLLNGYQEFWKCKTSSYLLPGFLFAVNFVLVASVIKRRAG